MPALTKFVLSRAASIRPTHLAVVLIYIAVNHYSAILVLCLIALLLAKASAIVRSVGLLLLLLNLLLILYLLEAIGGALILLLLLRIKCFIGVCIEVLECFAEI